jgi:hypothetical protein
MEPTDRFCPIKFVPFRGVNCSDAAGHEIEYHLIQDTLDNNESLTGRMWDDSVSSPWYNYKDAGALFIVHARAGCLDVLRNFATNALVDTDSC